MAKTVFFDSKECEWSDMTVYIDGATTTKLEGIHYKVSQEKKILHGTGKKAISIQSGNEEVTGSLKVLKGALDSLNAAARIAGANSILDVAFDVVVTYKPAPGRPLQVDTIQGIEVSEFEKGWDQGADHMEITLPFMAIDVI